MGVLFKNGTVINAGDSFPADVLVEGERISLIGQSIAPEKRRQRSAARLPISTL